MDFFASQLLLLKNLIYFVYFVVERGSNLIIDGMLKVVDVASDKCCEEIRGSLIYGKLSNLKVNTGCKSSRG